MRIKPPKNSDKYFWTEHSIFKMRQYGLGEQRIRRIIKNPKRKEEGIVENTIAVMQPASTRRDDCSSRRGGPVGSKKEKGKETWKQEIWVMYQLKSKVNPPAGGQKSKVGQLKIISTWRYPGISPKRNPVPEDILKEIKNLSSDC